MAKHYFSTHIFLTIALIFGVACNPVLGWIYTKQHTKYLEETAIRGTLFISAASFVPHDTNLRDRITRQNTHGKQ